MPHADPEARRKYQEEYRAKNREALLAYHRNRPEQNRERNRKSYNKWRRRRIHAHRAYMLRYTYGIEPKEAKALYNSQGGRCAICSTLLSTSKSAQLDHDHNTGQVRGYLCQPCNMILGLAIDDPEILRSAIAYMDRHARTGKLTAAT